MDFFLIYYIRFSNANSIMKKVFFVFLFFCFKYGEYETKNGRKADFTLYVRGPDLLMLEEQIEKIFDLDGLSG